jgi:hypothetical protein
MAKDSATTGRRFAFSFRAVAAAAALNLHAVPGCNFPGTAAGPAGLHELFGETVAVEPLRAGPARPGDLGLMVLRGSSGVVGYAADQRVVSRSGPFVIRAVIGPGFRVLRADVLEYTGARGREVRRAGFRRQFVGKGPGDAIRVGEDIDAVTGATISSRAMAAGVRRAVQRTRQRFAAGT